ncbi:MAG: hypothetical protein WBP10_12305 [Thermoanaerobaculia bacterium]
MKSNIEQRIESLESEDDRTGTGVHEVEAEELERWWAQWDGSHLPIFGPGAMLIPRELTHAEWEQHHGSPIEVKTKKEST